MKGLLDVAGAAEYLSISRRSMERLVENDEIVAVRLPGIRKNLFRPEDLDNLIRDSRPLPVSVFGPTNRHIVAVSRGSRRRS